jgi:hypothetical protein
VEEGQPVSGEDPEQAGRGHDREVEYGGDRSDKHQPSAANDISAACHLPL